MENNEFVLGSDGIHSHRLIAENTYQISERGIANMYLLIGNEKALLIDSGIGVGNLKETIGELTSLPCEMIVTHNHPDHAGGRGWFKNYYLCEKDNRFIYHLLSSKFVCRKFLDKNPMTKDLKLADIKFYSKKILFEEPFSIELGDRKIDVYNTPGHTKGSIVLVDKKANIIYTGDNVICGLWLQLPGSTSLSTWIKGARRTMELSKGMAIWDGHLDYSYTDKEVLEEIKVGEKILSLGKKAFKKNIFFYPTDQDAKFRILIKRSNVK